MAKFNQRDFLIGAALYSLLQHNLDARPSMIENTEDASYLKVATNTTTEFGLYIKVTKAPRENKTWTLSLTESDKKRIDGMYSELPSSYVFFVLGEQYKSGEVLVLRRSEYEKIAHKSSITIKHSSETRAHEFHIMDGKAVILKVKRNRIEQRLSNTEVAIP
ncbi:MAG: hypothetical protein VB087_06535 [Candidatus Limiplasma sp.]|nr:hypothetical protein [Candidatus Limiplasma sp.]